MTPSTIHLLDYHIIACSLAVHGPYVYDTVVFSPENRFRSSLHLSCSSAEEEEEGGCGRCWRIHTKLGTALITVETVKYRHGIRTNAFQSAHICIRRRGSMQEVRVFIAIPSRICLRLWKTSKTYGAT
jgi:hypothetical protein